MRRSAEWCAAPVRDPRFRPAVLFGGGLRTGIASHRADAPNAAMAWRLVTTIVPIRETMSFITSIVSLTKRRR